MLHLEIITERLKREFNLDIREFDASPKIGDKIKIRERSITKSPFANLDEKMKEGNAIPAWLKFDLTKKEAVVAGKPIADTTGLDLNSIIEFYSR